MLPRDTKTRKLALAGLLPAAAFVLSACDRSSSGRETLLDARAQDVAVQDARSADGFRDVPSRPDAVPDAVPVGSCRELASSDCFSNYDCSMTERCQNVGTADEPVACCVSGARGQGRAGEPCTSENDCASGVCIEHEATARCSDVCSSPQDCPEGMRRCIYVALSGSDDKWCFPE